MVEILNGHPPVKNSETQERKYGISDLYISIKGSSIFCCLGKMTRICYVKFLALVIRLLFLFLKVN
jgi:hypothetical protein